MKPARAFPVRRSPWSTGRFVATTALLLATTLLLAGTIASAQTPVTNYTYDANGNLTSIAAPLSRTTGSSFDALNRALVVTNPLSGATSYVYNGRDQVTSVTDPRGLTTSYTIDGLGNTTSQVSPDTGATSRTYDAAGNLKTQTDARGKTGTYTYDALNRVTAISYGANNPSNVTYSYDAGTNGKGRLTGMTDASGSTAWSYDQKGRVIRKQSEVIGIVVVTAYGYDAAGRLGTLTYPSGKIVTYGYDAAGRIASITIDGYPLVSNIAWQPFGPPKSWTWGDGSSSTRSFDGDGRMATHTIAGTVRTVTYDLASRITKIDDGTPATTSTYSFDALDRLTGYVAPTTTQGYSYDANGNRTQLGIGGNNYAYANASTSNRLNSTAGPAPAKAFTHDAAGNITSDGSRSFGYADNGRLTSVTFGSDNLSQQFNGLGQRPFKSSSQNPRVVFAYDEAGHFLGDYDMINKGVPIREYIYLGDMPVVVLTNNAYVLDNTGTGVTVTGTWPTGYSSSGFGYDYRYHAAGTGTSTVTWTPTLPASAVYKVYARWAAGTDRATNATYEVTHLGGVNTVTVNQQQRDGEWVYLGGYSMVIGQGHKVKLTDNANGVVVADALKFVPADASTVYSIHTDHLNTPRAVKSSAGVVVWRWESDPFGTSVANQDADGNGILFTFPMRFPGQYFDTETATHYNYFRDYDPQIGRYVQSDPIGLAGGINTYSYVGGNPISFIDPDGLRGRTNARPVGGNSAQRRQERRREEREREQDPGPVEPLSHEEREELRENREENIGKFFEKIRRTDQLLPLRPPPNLPQGCIWLCPPTSPNACSPIDGQNCRIYCGPFISSQ